jgi:adenine-specific DNA-methyltransferase
MTNASDPVVSPAFAGSNTTLFQGDCLAVLPTLPDNSVDLIVTDPPYFRVKKDAWDRQWNTSELFLEWLDCVFAQFYRVLRPNGSLYVFASPQMAARVECLVTERFDVVNRITWRKPPFSTKAEMTTKEKLRSFYPASEAIIFAEHKGSDNIAKGEAGYEAKCDKLRGFIFEPIRKYLDDERAAAGISVREVAEAFQKKTGSRTVTGMAGHWFGTVQWALPTLDNYQWLRSTLGGTFLSKSYEELRAQYEELRAQYEELRRPFAVTADVPYTDVWDFPTVSHYAGKHNCEKPQALLRHIITASSRPGAVVLDAFFGSGAVGEAAEAVGRRCVAIEMSEHWVQQAAKRLKLQSYGGVSCSAGSNTSPLVAE